MSLHREALAKFTRQALNNSQQSLTLLNTEVSIMRKAVLQNWMTLDILTASQGGGTCVVIHTVLSLYQMNQGIYLHSSMTCGPGSRLLIIQVLMPLQLFLECPTCFPAYRADPPRCSILFLWKFLIFTVLLLVTNIYIFVRFSMCCLPYLCRKPTKTSLNLLILGMKIFIPSIRRAPSHFPCSAGSSQMRMTPDPLFPLK